MPLLRTAKQHFDEDIQRAGALVDHATGLPGGELCDDILRAAWMMAAGACDAYFSDAYADLVSRTLRAKEFQPEVEIPNRLGSLRIPATAIIRRATGGWRWRMAARELIEKENVLSLDRINQLFNQFFRNGRKIIKLDTIATWIVHRQAQQRLFGISRAQYRNLAPARKRKSKQAALEQFQNHYQELFQRRHDCIHNCDRPKVALQRIGQAQVKKRIEDIEFLVERCHEALLEEYPTYLKGLGFTGLTRNRVSVHPA